MEKITYTARDISELLGISISNAYALLHREDFPTLKIGCRLFVVRDQFDEWLLKQSNCAV